MEKKLRGSHGVQLENEQWVFEVLYSEGVHVLMFLLLLRIMFPFSYNAF